MNKEQILENFIIDVMNYVIKIESDITYLKKVKDNEKDNHSTAFLLGCIGSRIRTADDLQVIIDKAVNKIEEIEIGGK